VGDDAAANGDLERLKAGDPAAFDALVRARADGVYRIAAGIVGPDEAEDVVQEVFLRVHEALPRFRGDSAIGTWIHRIAVNAALKRRARGKRREAGSLEGSGPPARGPTSSERLSAAEREAALRRALERLPPEQRAVVALRCFEGLTAPEAARVLGVAVPTVESRFGRAKTRLKEILSWLLGESSRGGGRPS
jgi:RNA polymerase sigma-70 factor (ECF subfamily)